MAPHLKCVTTLLCEILISEKKTATITPETWSVINDRSQSSVTK